MCTCYLSIFLPFVDLFKSICLKLKKKIAFQHQLNDIRIVQMTHKMFHGHNKLLVMNSFKFIYHYYGWLFIKLRLEPLKKFKFLFRMETTRFTRLLRQSIVFSHFILIQFSLSNWIASKKTASVPYKIVVVETTITEINGPLPLARSFSYACKHLFVWL